MRVCFAHAIFNSPAQHAKCFRPFIRRRASTLRPPTDRSLARKPCLFFRFRQCGWYVRFVLPFISHTSAGSSEQAGEPQIVSDHSDHGLHTRKPMPEENRIASTLCSPTCDPPIASPAPAPKVVQNKLDKAGLSSAYRMDDFRHAGALRSAPALPGPLPAAPAGLLPAESLAYQALQTAASSRARRARGLRCLRARRPKRAVAMSRGNCPPVLRSSTPLHRAVPTPRQRTPTVQQTGRRSLRRPSSCFRAGRCLSPPKC